MSGYKPKHKRSVGYLWALGAITLAVAALLIGALPAQQTDPAVPPDFNNPGILEPVSSALQGRDIRIPNTDQSIDGTAQDNIEGDVVFQDAFAGQSTSLLGHTIDRVSSPNADMRRALRRIFFASRQGDTEAMEAQAAELKSILFGTTEGRIYDGFAMLNYNRWKTPDIVGPEHFPPDAMPEEYKMKRALDTGRTFISPFDGEERTIWEVDINMLYYDGQIDSDTFLVRFPFGHHPDDVLHVNYRIYSLVEEDFAPTLVMLDRREEPRTVNFPFKGFDAVWVAFFPGQVVDLTVKYPPIRMIRGVYDWGWRVHPPRIQFMQPIYEIRNAHTGEIQLDAQGISFATRTREDLTLDSIGEAAPEMKMLRVVEAIEGGASAQEVEAMIMDRDVAPQGRWFEWVDLATFQTQLPPEAWEIVEQEDGLKRGEFGELQMISVFLNNEMYGNGPFLNEIKTWQQGELFHIKLINMDNHTHYFRNVDFGARLNDDILKCCGGGLTSFEIMNFAPSYGAPKVAEMQWRAGWGFRPHYDVIQQQGVFSRGQDRALLKPYRSGLDDTYFGYQYSEEHRGGDFRFNPPPFVILEADEPAPFPLRDSDGQPGLLIGQRTEGYGIAQTCPQDPFPGFCVNDWFEFNPLGVANFPPPPLRGQPVMPVDVGKFPGDVYPDEAVELRFPPFLRNPSQGDPDAGDIIPPTDVWRTFLWLNPKNGTLFIDPDDPSKGHWADLTFSHGATVRAHTSLNASIELPRASGQVFYQFDDLFHDNAIFSPHPVATSTGSIVDIPDAIAAVSGAINGPNLAVSGELEKYEGNDKFAPFVSIFAGSAGSAGCSGSLLAVVETNQANGRFSFQAQDTGVSSGDTVCVQTVIGAFFEIRVD
ncbi:MAG TPA: hypothetical protein VLV83_12690 [Acidobacteriota bacterium]|nr:hypothetical protein [Acidobacteriota bacterium]